MASTLRMTALPHRSACGQPSTSGRTPCAVPQALRLAAVAPRSQLHHRLRAIADDSYSSGRVADEEYMKEYKGLKDQLQDNTRKCGAVVAAYLLFSTDGEAALCVLLGTAASYLYLQLLYNDVDSYRGDSVVPMMQADEIENGLLRRVAKVGAAYQQALRPRLLVPVAVAVLAAAYNLVAPEEARLDLLHQGCLLLGFLAYKMALLIKLVDELTPKTFTDNTESRPRLEPIEDDLDMFGRPKRKTLRMPTDALPEGVDSESVEKMPLAKIILAADAEAQAQAAAEAAEQPRK
ncbi:hypothetical protein HYH03_004785 [Edaphochlamys debaryana]|uniref:CGL160/ATPI domain-containing protein n=1 Tax=Edaphochlamys debaryana TaxID=47281 RepID=A0A835YAE2_9CHLO|nr:hypothetical protein HYH03_004785 [Edaphochlamys debaryana]|eukprot:KAG2497196.1 hypothetical protein HYH03_004785 [Edaphochlamys debaryana]